MRASTLLAAIAATGTVALPGLASAQDWAGPYVGVQATSSSLETSAALDVSGPIATNIATHVAFGEAHQPRDLGGEDETYGAQLGYLFQRSSWVFGGELAANSGSDFDSVVIEQPVPAVTGSAYITTLSSDWSASFRLRGGWATRNLMIYALGGYDLRDVTLTERYRIISTAAPGSVGYIDFVADDTVSGWTYGLGVEWRPLASWGVRLEYAHTDYEDLSDDGVITGTFAGNPALQGTGRLESGLEEDAIRLAVAYHF